MARTLTKQDELPLRTRAVFRRAPTGQALTLWLLDQKEAGDPSEDTGEGAALSDP